MSDNLTTPIGAGTALATKDIAGVQYPKSLITDQTGADAVGLVTATPDANSILGRLKAIATALAGNLSVTGTFWQATQPISVASLPLPAGAATATAQATGNTSLANVDVNTAAAGPAATAGAVTPSDTTVLTARAIYVGGTGNVVATIGGTDVTFTAVGAGTLLPIKATKIKAATTATNIVWLG